jgi:hypothetical protein
MCKEKLSYLPKVVGIDIVELALWAKVQHDQLLTCFCSMGSISRNIIFTVISKETNSI